MIATVTWAMDIDDTEITTAQQAAEYALSRINDGSSWAHVFTVTERGETSLIVDLDAEPVSIERADDDTAGDGKAV